MKKTNGTKQSKISWIMYDINWPKLAKSSCKKCHGRGFEGFEVLPEAEERKLLEEDENWSPQVMLCNCAAQKWTKMNDEDRMNYATLKENAEEMQEKAVEMVKQVASEEAENAGIELT